MAWRYVSLFLGVFACSTSAIFIKESRTHPFVLAALRLLFAAVLLTPVFLRDLRRHRANFTRDHVKRTVLPAAVLGIHLIAWTYGARMTLAAQASLIVNLAPIAIPFFLHALVGERINRREILGTVVAIGGVVALTLRDAISGGGDFRGNVVCFGAMLLFAWYLALGRKNRDFPSVWLYVVPVYAFAALICVAIAAVKLPTFEFGSKREWLLMLALAGIPTIVGHTLLNAGMRHLRGQIVSLANVGQFIFADAIAAVVFQEHPSPMFYAASALVVGGIALVVFSTPETTAETP